MEVPLKGDRTDQETAALGRAVKLTHRKEPAVKVVDEPVDGVEPQDERWHLERGNQVALVVAGLLGAGASRRRQRDSEDDDHGRTSERSHADLLRHERRRG